MNIRASVLAALLLATAVPVAPVFTSSVVFADQYDRRVYVINHSRYDVWYINASNVGKSYYYDDDLLGEAVLSPGEEIWINPEDYSGYCVYDFIAYDENKSTIDKITLNACARDALWVIR